MALQDRYEQIGAANTTADDLSATPVGTKGTPGSAPYAAGTSGDQPPAEAARLVNPPPVADGTPAPTP